MSPGWSIWPGRGVMARSLWLPPAVRHPESLWRAAAVRAGAWWLRHRDRRWQAACACCCRPSHHHRHAVLVPPRDDLRLAAGKPPRNRRDWRGPGPSPAFPRPCPARRRQPGSRSTPSGISVTNSWHSQESRQDSRPGHGPAPGHVQAITTHAPAMEGGITVAPPAAGPLPAATSSPPASRRAAAPISPDGTVTTLAASRAAAGRRHRCRERASCRPIRSSGSAFLADRCSKPSQSAPVSCGCRAPNWSSRCPGWRPIASRATPIRSSSLRLPSAPSSGLRQQAGDRRRRAHRVRSPRHPKHLGSYLQLRNRVCRRRHRRNPRIITGVTPRPTWYRASVMRPLSASGTIWRGRVLDNRRAFGLPPVTAALTGPGPPGNPGVRSAHLSWRGRASGDRGVARRPGPRR